MLDTVISECGRYRYRLKRKVSEESDIPCCFIMLNPSTADATEDDPTIRRCMGYARDWGCGELIVVNLFGIRATNPKAMLAASDPVGPDNRDHVECAVDYAVNVSMHGRGAVICAWGNHGAYMEQGLTVLGWIDHYKPMCLRVNGKSGQPAHPLYLPKTLKPVPFGWSRNRKENGDE